MLRVPYVMNVQGDTPLIDGHRLVGRSTWFWCEMRGTNSRNQNRLVPRVKVPFRNFTKGAASTSSEFWALLSPIALLSCALPSTNVSKTRNKREIGNRNGGK